LAVADFPTPPLRLYNLTTTVDVTKDDGSQNVPLTWQGGGVAGGAAGPDGTRGAAIWTAGGHYGNADTGLPAALASRSYGCWFKTTTVASMALMAWGVAGNIRILVLGPGAAAGTLRFDSGTDTPASEGYFADGQWHFVVETNDAGAVDGVRRKWYVDGRLIGGSTVLNAVTLAGANRFRVGADSDGGIPFTGQIDGAFVCDYALTTAQVLSLWAKGSQPLSPSPKNAGDHVESWDATSVLATFDTLGSSSQVDLGVAA
jgi:hypothetical protein